MKKFYVLSAIALLLCASGAQAAVIYNDATGETATPGAPFPNLDFVSVEVSNTATDLIFKLNLVGDPVATDWGKYMVGIDSTAGGDTAGNGWGRPIGMSSGMDFWLGSWVDGGNGMEVRAWNGSSWVLQSASYNAVPPLSAPTKDSSSVTLSVPLSYLGLTVGNSFTFDVYSSGGGGGDGAVDALGNPAITITNWGDSYNSGANVNSYTVVPEPATAALMAWVAVAAMGLSTKRRRSA